MKTRFALRIGRIDDRFGAELIYEPLHLRQLLHLTFTYQIINVEFLIEEEGNDSRKSGFVSADSCAFFPYASFVFTKIVLFVWMLSRSSSNNSGVKKMRLILKYPTFI